MPSPNCVGRWSAPSDRVARSVAPDHKQILEANQVVDVDHRQRLAEVAVRPKVACGHEVGEADVVVDVQTFKNGVAVDPSQMA